VKNIIWWIQELQSTPDKKNKKKNPTKAAHNKITENQKEKEKSWKQPERKNKTMIGTEK